MDLNAIPHSPNAHFFIFGNALTIDLNLSVKKRLGSDNDLTNEKAIKIFKDIALKSNLVAFLTSSSVIVVFASLAFTAAFIISVNITTPILVITQIFLFVFGGSILGYAFFNPFNTISLISQAYTTQGKLAQEQLLKLDSYSLVL